MGEAGIPGRGRTVDLGGPVHYVDFGGDADGPTLVLVHGLGGSHLNWDLLAPLLTPHARVLALDLPGFGRSEPGERRASVPANVAVLHRFLTEVVGAPAVLVGNSMGGMISIFQAARAPESVHGLVLVDAALPGPRRALDPVVALSFAVYAVPLLGERFLWWRRVRRTPLARVREMLRLCGVDPDSVPSWVIDRSVTLLEERRDVEGMDKAFLAAARSLLRELVDPRRYREAMASIPVPVLMLQGDRDRLVPVAAAREAARHNPGWHYRELPGVGHVPQLQTPELVAEHVLEWLRDTAEVPSPASDPAQDSVARSASSPV
ncbi:MAG TPA: alpha/beta fold hydrolase [Geodermatophilus sp.]|nr:alpha/beta fold hydrolase [Geodermatophilus sp.]